MTMIMQKRLRAVFEQSKIYCMKDLQPLLTGNAKDVCEAIKNDMAYQLVLDMQETFRDKVAENLNTIQTEINQLQRLYMQAQMDVFTQKSILPRCQQHPACYLWQCKKLSTT